MTTTSGMQLIVVGVLSIVASSNGGRHISNESYDNVASDPLTLLQNEYMERIEFNSTDERATELRIAVILPRNVSRMFSIQKVLPAMELAISGDEVKRLVPGRRWTILHADSNCSSTVAPRVMLQYLLSAQQSGQQVCSIIIKIHF